MLFYDISNVACVEAPHALRKNRRLFFGGGGGGAALHRLRSLAFLTVDATIGNQAFTYDRCSIFPVLNNNTANDMLLNSPRKNDVEAQLEFT